LSRTKWSQANISPYLTVFRIGPAILSKITMRIKGLFLNALQESYETPKERVRKKKEKINVSRSYVNSIILQKPVVRSRYSSKVCNKVPTHRNRYQRADKGNRVQQINSKSALEKGIEGGVT
jgi:hypothetical protein